MTLALTALARQRDTDRLPTLVVHGASLAPSLVAFLTDHRVAVQEADGDLKDRIRDRELTVALVVSEDYPQRIEAARPARVTLLFDGSWSSSRQHADRARALLAEYAKGIRQHPAHPSRSGPAVQPLDVAENDLSTPSSRAATALATLPLFVLLAAFVGGMGIAADLTAGERERGMLEFLLTHPSPRVALIAGKWLVAALASVATVTLTLIVTRLSFSCRRSRRSICRGGVVGERSVPDVACPRAAGVHGRGAPGVDRPLRAQLQGGPHAALAADVRADDSRIPVRVRVDSSAGLDELGADDRPARPVDHTSRGPACGSGDVVAVTAVTVVAMALALGAASRLLEREWIVRRAAG